VGVSSYLVLMVPYLVSLIALFALSWRNRDRVYRTVRQTFSLTPKGT
jgi:ABC-type uncharacterized transport system permease subunit